VPLNQEVSAFWAYGNLTDYEIANLLSFVRDGYKVNLYSYDKNLRPPKGVELLDAREISPESSVFRNHESSGTFAAFSDIFRYKLLTLKDTIWIDTDVISGSHRISGLGGYVFGWQRAEYVNCAVLAAPRDSEFIKVAVFEATQKDPSKIFWGEIGPALVTEIIKRYGLEDKIQPRNAFYAISHLEVWKFFDPRSFEEVSQRTSTSSAIHLWNEMMQRAPLEVKKGSPHPKSFLGQHWKDVGLSTSLRNRIRPEKVRKFWAVGELS